MSTQTQHSELRGARAALFVLLVVALALRVAAALRKSLVLDEFHTWFHATRPSLQAFFETLELDNHPPLGFAAVALARVLFGSSELALRTPALLFGLVELVLLFVLARRLCAPRVALAATALLTLSSLHIDFSSQARMYALHSLARSPQPSTRTTSALSTSSCTRSRWVWSPRSIPAVVHALCA